MNLLLLGNVGSGKSTLSRELLARGFTEQYRYYAIDDLRYRYSDGTFSGEFFAWSLMFRAAQSERSGLFEFSGVGKNAPSFRSVMQESMSQGNLWAVVNCDCHIDVIAERLDEKPSDVPLPQSSWKNNEAKMKGVESTKISIDAQANTNFWNCPELTIRTDLNTISECADRILTWLAEQDFDDGRQLFTPTTQLAI
jgi:GTPase SAR1 family protein